MVEPTVRKLLAGTAYRLHAGPVWLMALPDGRDLPEHGWKLHISARATELAEVAEIVVPVLLAEGCAFKLARGQDQLDELNDGTTSPTSVGKAFTVYPDQNRVRELGIRLAGLLCGRSGPRVLSDRRVREDAPVYYRYGPFVPSWRADEHGNLVSRLRGPNGETFDAPATLAYRQPSWVTDPFNEDAQDRNEEAQEQGDPDEEAAATLLGGHYRIVAGVYESARGNVYRAIDDRNGSTVIVKQARALVEEKGEGNDTRIRLRNERHALSALEGVAGVPRFLDHFRHGDDEFLVVTDQGPASLEDDVHDNGTYPLAGSGSGGAGRTLETLARKLARIVLDLHERGVIMQDIAPKNVIVDGGNVSLIDFGLAACNGVHVRGATPGYAPARQRRQEPPRESDDLHALGMTLWYATSRQMPVWWSDELDLPQRRALQQIHWTYGPKPDGVIGAVVDLLSDNEDHARTAVRRLAFGDLGRHRCGTGLPAVPKVRPQIVADLTATVLADLLHLTTDIAAVLADVPAAHDASIYSGSAGIVLELLRHKEVPGVKQRLSELVTFTTRAAERAGLSPGLYGGRTGVDLVLHTARADNLDVPIDDAFAVPVVPDATWTPDGDDLIVGAAGVGIAHLAFHADGLGESHREVAQRCLDAVLAPGGLRSAYATEDYPASAAIDPTLGSAHGLAGVIEFLLAYAEQTCDATAFEEAAYRSRELATRAAPLIERAESPAAVPLSVSWCQGLTGIGHALLRAGCVLDDLAFVGLARKASEVAASWLPRLTTPGTCCGVAGVGNLLIQVALVTGDEKYWKAANDAVTQLLLRSAGSTDHPSLLDSRALDGTLSWAQGLTGLLMFLRRLRDLGGHALPHGTPMG